MTTQDKGAEGEFTVTWFHPSQDSAVALLDAEIARPRKENEALKQQAESYRQELVDMCWQFAGRGKDDALWTMGMSDLESAFAVLGWPNPCPKDQAV